MTSANSSLESARANDAIAAKGACAKNLGKAEASDLIGLWGGRSRACSLVLFDSGEGFLSKTHHSKGVTSLMISYRYHDHVLREKDKTTCLVLDVLLFRLGRAAYPESLHVEKDQQAKSCRWRLGLHEGRTRHCWLHQLGPQSVWNE